MNQDALALLLAKKFVQQKLVKAIQKPDGTYRPVRVRYPDGDYVPWKMGDFRKHVAGTETYGHYTCDSAGFTKVLTFDIDLCKIGTYCIPPNVTELDKWYTNEDFEKAIQTIESTPRADWHDRRHPGRVWYKYQMRTLLEWISSTAFKDFGMQVACAYSGNKGCHVYCFFPEPTPAGVARELSLLILEATAERIGGGYKFEQTKGHSFFKFNDTNPYTGFQNLEIEIYPKQDEALGDKLGNLVRLPLGKNNKNPKDPCFFIDQTTKFLMLKPHPDPVALLEGKSPWS